MLSFNLRPLFEARGIEKPYTFLIKAGFSSFTAHCILNNKTRSLKLNCVELLCKVLLCEPNDLLKWTPEKGSNYPDNFPLLKLIHSDIENNWRETLNKMPFKELKEVTKKISEKKSGDN